MEHDTAEIALCMYRMPVALKDLCASHRSDHAARGAGAPYIPQTDAKRLTWSSGRAAAAGVAAVLPDEVLKEAYTDYGHDWLCMRYKITAAAAKAVQKRTATKHINTALQKALLVAIEKEVKLKHLLDIPEVVENKQKFGVISMAESNFLMKFSPIALFLQMSIIIWSEVKAWLEPLSNSSYHQIFFGLWHRTSPSFSRVLISFAHNTLHQLMTLLHG